MSDKDLVEELAGLNEFIAREGDLMAQVEASALAFMSENGIGELDFDGMVLRAEG